MAKQKLDPIRGIYYKPWEDAEVWEDRIFVAAAILSLAILFIGRDQYPDLYNVTQVAFLMLVIGLFLIGHWIRLYLSPRAEGSRRDDLLADSFSVVTADPRTVGYY